MKDNYFLKRDRNNIKTIAKYLEVLPDFCLQYFLEKENYSSTNTRLGNAVDLSVFFDFICRFKFANTPKEITYSHINKITTTDISSFLSYLSFYEYNGKNYKNNNEGKSRKLASVRSLFRWLYKKDYITQDVASKIDTPKKIEKQIIRLEPHEVVKIINTAESGDNMTKTQKSFNKHTSVRDTALLTLFLSTGIRVSECVGLDIEDFDFDNNAFKITRKGGNQTILYLSEEAKLALLHWLEVRATLNIPENEHAMFVSLQKRRMTVRTVEYLVKKYAQIINPLKKITPHKLRSTFGTNLYQQTNDIYMVADVLGHKDVNTTRKHYAAIGEESKRKVASIIKLRDTDNGTV